jgi:hypothetical protein
MDRAGRSTSQLSPEEMTMVFDLVSQGGSSEEARRFLAARGRNRTTANRLYNVVRELETRGLDVLDTTTTEEIAQAARYSTTPSFVQGVHLRWRAWRNRDNSCQDHVHQEFLRDRLTWVMLELQPLPNSFPGVFRLSYRPEDPANRLKWLDKGGQQNMESELGAEQQPSWSLVQQHLLSGMPEAAQALVRVKHSYAAYCERLLTLEDNFRKRVQENVAQMAGRLELNHSHFYRSILADVDKHGEAEKESEYRYGASQGYSFVAFAGVQLISQAVNSAGAQQWVELHQQWRLETRSEHLASLLKLRQDIRNNAWVVVTHIDDLEQGGPVPGRCNRSS